MKPLNGDTSRVLGAEFARSLEEVGSREGGS